MPFLKRLGFYLIGLSIGLIFLTFFLKKKAQETGTEFCYLPNCRVLKDLRSKPLSYAPRIQERLQNGALDSVQIAYFLSEGDIVFKKSDTKSRPCKTYVIEGKLDEKDAVLKVRSCENEVIVEELVQF